MKEIAKKAEMSNVQIALEPEAASLAIFYDKNIKRHPQLHFSEALSPFKYYIIKEKRKTMQEIVKVKKLQNRKIKYHNN